MTALPPALTAALTPVLTMGDPAGIGPEITAKAWQALSAEDDAGPFFVIACPNVMARACRDLDLPAPITIKAPQDAAAVFADAVPVLPIDCADVTPGKPDSRAAPAIINAIETAVALTLRGEASAVVTNPIAKSVLYEAGFAHPGHTEFLGALTQSAAGPDPRGPVMMLSAAGLHVALATIHIAIKDVPGALTSDGIVKTARIMDQALRDYFGVKAPRIALTGLNPHAGEAGSIGREDIDIINPAAAQLRAMGIDATDAQPADTLFHEEAREGYDAVLAMYHDQGLIPVKTLDFHGGVNITLGLPIIRTSPDHGTAFDIAGAGVARPDSLIAAIKRANAMAQSAAQL